MLSLSARLMQQSMCTAAGRLRCLTRCRVLIAATTTILKVRWLLNCVHDAYLLKDRVLTCNCVAHHVNWVEDDLMLIGYQKYEDEDTTALACLFEKGEWVNLDELVAYFDVEGRRHQYYSVYLPDWFVPAFIDLACGEG